MIRTGLTNAMPILAGAPDDAFHSPQRLLEFVLAIADGRLDRLSGRYFHTQHDDLDAVLAQADAILAADARRLRLAMCGPADRLP
jgi:hypothetical protein